MFRSRNNKNSNFFLKGPSCIIFFSCLLFVFFARAEDSGSDLAKVANGDGAKRASQVGSTKLASKKKNNATTSATANGSGVLRSNPNETIAGRPISFVSNPASTSTSTSTSTSNSNSNSTFTSTSTSTSTSTTSSSNVTSMTSPKESLSSAQTPILNTNTDFDLELGVDPDLKREVTLSFEPEKHARKYIIEIQTGSEQPSILQESEKPEWSGYLRLGQYQVRLKVVFNDDTESAWSSATNLNVEPYKLGLVNLDENFGKIVKDDKGESTTFLNWNKLSDARSYSLILRESASIDLANSQNSNLKTKEIKKPKTQIVKEIVEPGIRLGGISSSGIYYVKIIAKDAQGKVIALGEQKIYLLETYKLKPTISKPRSDYVRKIDWSSAKGFDVFSLKLYKQALQDSSGLVNNNTIQEVGKVPDKPEDLLVFSDQKYQGLSFSMPEDWSGGNYKICLSSLIAGHTFSDEECLFFAMKEGDRSLTSERTYFKEIASERYRQYFHVFDIVASRVNYSSVNTSVSSDVEIEGYVFSASYAKSNPTGFKNLNEYYKINLGFVNIESNYFTTFDFRYGREFIYLSKYPFVFKSNVGLGAERLLQAETDSASASELKTESHYLLKAFAVADLQYDLYDEMVLGLRFGYNYPFYELSRSNGSKLSSGSIREFSVNGIFKVPNSKDRFEIGYLYRSQETYFLPETSGYAESRVTQSGQYIILSYILETK